MPGEASPTQTSVIARRYHSLHLSPKTREQGALRHAAQPAASTSSPPSWGWESHADKRLIDLSAEPECSSAALLGAVSFPGIFRGLWDTSVWAQELAAGSQHGTGEECSRLCNSKETTAPCKNWFCKPSWRLQTNTLNWTFLLRETLISTAYFWSGVLDFISETKESF